MQAHKRKNGEYPNEAIAQLMTELEARASQIPSSDSSSIASTFGSSEGTAPGPIHTLPQMLQDITGRPDHPGCSRGYGIGVTKKRLKHPEGTFVTQTMSQATLRLHDMELQHQRDQVTILRVESENHKLRAEAAEARLEAERARFEAERAMAAAEIAIARAGRT